ncbi:MAG TPA: excinuclease ABC subunit UvrA [Bacteroidia bacterium]|nr:MAG: excinuclease ABC subunit A [Bacteroidetes bacterium OLB10]MBV6453272.1 UvrABC system protein A [Bacteroidia bacterium]MBX3105332.1 excinuclease ABC subunit UvrA [Bacteroidota bacterium]MCE7955507.1 excinuclease ABC subunit UvrA [Bacteroidetes bacterium CHB6]MCB0849281.1 excinuclease ABC subunit UvrA [Bacteroidota bacterium]
MQTEHENIEVYGAREHNLKNIDVVIPREKLVVITGLSGSGKSSLAFDTIYAEGQRRYMESFSAYARQFLGSMERPDVDKINGLSPVISIEQKTTNQNPRSTVGTVTEIYDFLRLMFARAGEAYSYITGDKMIRLSDEQIVDIILKEYEDKQITILSPVVKARKGHYRELFEQIRISGFIRVRIDGEITEIKKGLQADRYKTHDIEIVVDKISVSEASRNRISDTVKTAMKFGKNTLMVHTEGAKKIRYFSRNLMCPVSGISYDEPAPNTFSFNSPYGACPKCNGLGTIPEIDMSVVIPNPKKTIRQGGLAPIGEYKNNWIFNELDQIGKKYGYTLNTPVEDIPEEAMSVILYGTDEISGNIHSHSGHDVTFEGIVSFLINQYEETSSPSVKKWAQSFMVKNICPECNGTRLKKESLWFKINEKNIAELSNMDLSELQNWLQQLPVHLTDKQKTIATEVLKEITKRVGFLLDVGLDYITLNRSTRSLSGGESQRIRLATQIGSQLVGVLYILDEPSIGLHQRDNKRLITALKELRDLGNTVIVVEHDRETIEAADYVIDLGPGAGNFGGNVVATGTPEETLNQDSLTAHYLSGKIKMPDSKLRKGNGKKITINGARGNNLKNISVSLPLGKLICVTGVSGSGKSTLINETLYPALNHHFFRSLAKPLPYTNIKGLENIDKVIEIDQSPIGRTPRSNPATYTGVFTDIRNLFAQLPEAKIRGYSPGSFSFNVVGGRCDTCLGAGLKIIQMNFLPDVHVHCETCGGQRYKREILEVRYRGKSISDVLNLSIDEAVEFFSNLPAILHKIKTLKDVGLGYITLGQSSTTLSGGEAQRVKLATELSKKDTGNTFYILDEPTTGLHFEDVRILLMVLQQLVDKGNTVVVIEHNMDVIRAADHIIDLGPEGGMKGGTVIAEGTPEQIIKNKLSITGKYLEKEIEWHNKMLVL